jgi:hypothetical protein
MLFVVWLLQLPASSAMPSGVEGILQAGQGAEVGATGMATSLYASSCMPDGGAELIFQDRWVRPAARMS